MTSSLLLLALLGVYDPCGDLAWDASEPGARYEVYRGATKLGETTALSWPIGCTPGRYAVIARDAAGNRSQPAEYLDVAFGPCCVGCPIACTEDLPGCDKPAVPPDACCLAPLTLP